MQKLENHPAGLMFCRVKIGDCNVHCDQLLEWQEWRLQMGARWEPDGMGQD